MLSPDEAIELICSQPFAAIPEWLPLHLASGRILQEDILADNDLPPFDRVMMDGIAIDASSYLQGQREFPIEGIQRAGEAQKELRDKNSCLEVMTGAICPASADCIIPYEMLRIVNGVAHCEELEVKTMMHIHRAGHDRKKGDLLIPRGTIIGAPEIGVLASCGHSQVAVFSQPQTIIFSTGDELVEIEETPLPHQIRRSNVHLLRSLLKEEGIEAREEHLRDEAGVIRKRIEAALSSHDLIILSGGVSMGKFDLIPGIMKECGVEEVFHRIAQKPGKPMWFGRKGSVTVFALPGNPVSTMVCAVRYLLPWLNPAKGNQEVRNLRIRLKTLPSLKGNLRHFIPVKITLDGHALCGDPLPWNGSGDYAAFTAADAIVEIDPATPHQSDYPAFLLRKLF